MLELLRGVLLIACMIFVWWTYHRIFDVVYFDLGKGCVKEIIITIFLGGLLCAVIMKFWYIALVIAGIAVFLKVKE